MALWQIKVYQDFLGQQCLNRFFLDDPAVGGTYSSVGQWAFDNYNTHLKPIMDQGWSLINVGVTRVDLVGASEVVVVPTGAPVSGQSVNANPAATQVCALVAWAAEDVRPNRGRTYLTGVHENWTDATGKLTQSILDDVGTWATAMLDASAIDLGARLVIRGKDPANVGQLTENEIESFVVRDVLATQRRRRIGVGA